MLYVQDRMNNTLAVLDNYYNDTHTLILESGVSTYNFTIPKNQDGSEYLVRGNYVVLADDKGQGWKFTIMATDETHSSLDVECEDLGLELLNKVRNSWASPGTAQPFKFYFDKAVRDTGWMLGVNEISNLSRTLSWDGRDTALKRLLSICTQFDHAEIEFKVEFKNMQVTKQVVNVYKQRGANRSDVQLVYGDTVNDIRKTTEIRELATAIQGVGGVIQKDNPVEGEPEEHVDFSSLTYDDGEYFTPAGDPFLYARVANQQFNIKDTYLEDFYDYDTQDAQELLNRTLAQLKERCQPKVNYEVDLAKVDSSLNLGDTVTIIDHDYKPELLLSGRVLQIEKSYTDSSKNKATFGNFLILYSNISDQLRALQEQMNSFKPVANYMWLRYAKDDKGNGMTSTPTADTKYVAMLVNKKTGIPSDNPADYAGHWQLIKGSDGKDGIPGATGADGKTSYTHFAYADNVSGTKDFSVDDPTGRSYMGVYSDFTKADSTNPSDYVWSYTKGETGPEGMQGIPGKPGIDGKTPYTHVAYADNDEGGGFSQSPDNKAYMGWYTDYTETDSTDVAKYAWSLIKGADGKDGADGVAGKDGVGVKATVISYTQSTSGTTPPTTGWTAGVPTLIKGQYLWTKTVWTYTDSSAETGYTVSYNAKDGNTGSDGVAGKDGVGIKSTIITYQASTSGTTAPTGTWVSNPPSVPGGNYLWTRTVWSYTDGTNETGYSVAKAGEKGNDGKDGVAGKDGLGIKSTVIAYQLSSSGTATPTGTWSASVPALTKGQYLWTRTTLTYTDNSSENVYSVSYVAKDGNNGTNGVAGKDGVGIKSTAITYASSTSGTSAPTSGWVSTPPSAAAGQFIWTRTIWTYTDNTTETGYSVGKIGEKGATGTNGANGAPGKPGADGKTPYFHQAWADSKDGKINFSATDPTNRGYLGTYTDFTQADSTDPTKYYWVELVGAFEVGGINLIVRKDELVNRMIGLVGAIDPFAGSSVTKNIISVEPGKYLTMTRYNSAADNYFRFAFYDASGAVVKRAANDDWSHTEEVPSKSATFRISYNTNLIVKLERGRKSSEYTLAPEDAQEQIDTINQGLRDTNSKIAAVTKIDRQATAPTNPKNGDQWWVLSKDPTTGKDAIEAFKQWDGTQWADSIIQQSMLNIVTLNSVTLNSAVINSPDINVPFTNLALPGFPEKMTGVMTIKDAKYSIDGKYGTGGSVFHTGVTPDGWESYRTTTDGSTKLNYARVNFGELQLWTYLSGSGSGAKYAQGSLSGQDTVRNSIATPTYYTNGWAPWTTYWPFLLKRNGRQITISGYLKNTGSSSSDFSIGASILRLPDWGEPFTPAIIPGTRQNAVTGSTGDVSVVLGLDMSGILHIESSGFKVGQWLSFSASYFGKDLS